MQKSSKKAYVSPVTKKHEPLAIVQGSAKSGSTYTTYTSSGDRVNVVLYTECSLYYYY